MKIYIIAVALFIGIPIVYINLRHTPSQWEMAVQKVAQDGDTGNPLFEAMREYTDADAIAAQAREIIRTTNTQIKIATASNRGLPKEAENCRISVLQKVFCQP